MDLQRESLLRLPVYSDHNEAFLGYVLEIVINEEKTKFLGLVFRRRIFRPKWIIPFTAIVGVAKDHIVVEHDSVRWLPFDREFWLAWRRGRLTYPMIAMENDEEVGKIVDFASMDDGTISTLVVESGFFSKLRYIPYSQVKRIEDDVFILKKGSFEISKDKKTWQEVALSTAHKLGKATAKVKKKVQISSTASLIGKTSPIDLVNSNGDKIITKGQEITKDNLETVVRASKLSQLSAAVIGKSVGSKIKKLKNK